MKIFRIEEITLKPQIVLAHDMDDAVNIFAYQLVMGNRPASPACRGGVVCQDVL